MEGFTREELQNIRSRAVEMTNLMAQVEGRFDPMARAFIALANAADRIDRLMAKEEGDTTDSGAV